MKTKQKNIYQRSMAQGLTATGKVPVLSWRLNKYRKLAAERIRRAVEKCEKIKRRNEQWVARAYPPGTLELLEAKGI